MRQHIKRLSCKRQIKNQVETYDSAWGKKQPPANTKMPLSIQR